MSVARGNPQTVRVTPCIPEGARNVYLNNKRKRSARPRVSPPNRRCVSTAATIFDRACTFFEGVLNSATSTDRLAYLMKLMLWAWVMTVLGAVVIVALTATSASWWTIVASSLGGAAVERAGVVLIRRRRKRCAKRRL
jgi:hypothetical protein